MELGKTSVACGGGVNVMVAVLIVVGVMLASTIGTGEVFDFEYRMNKRKAVSKTSAKITMTPTTSQSNWRDFF